MGLGIFIYVIKLADTDVGKKEDETSVEASQFKISTTLTLFECSIESVDACFRAFLVKTVVAAAVASWKRSAEKEAHEGRTYFGLPARKVMCSNSRSPSLFVFYTLYLLIVSGGMKYM